VIKDSLTPKNGAQAPQAESCDIHFGALSSLTGREVGSAFDGAVSEVEL
jgi:hypothetical protein